MRAQKATQATQASASRALLCADSRLFWLAALYSILTLINDTIASNSAGYAGGGISNEGTLTLTNNTITSNSANWGGGGIFRR